MTMPSMQYQMYGDNLSSDPVGMKAMYRTYAWRLSKGELQIKEAHARGRWDPYYKLRDCVRGVGLFKLFLDGHPVSRYNVIDNKLREGSDGLYFGALLGVDDVKCIQQVLRQALQLHILTEIRDDDV